MSKSAGRVQGWMDGRIVGIWIEWRGIQIRCLHKIYPNGEFAFLIGSSFVVPLLLALFLMTSSSEWCQSGVIVELLKRPSSISNPVPPLSA